MFCRQKRAKELKKQDLLEEHCIFNGDYCADSESKDSESGDSESENSESEEDEKKLMKICGDITECITVTPADIGHCTRKTHHSGGLCTSNALVGPTVATTGSSTGLRIVVCLETPKAQTAQGAAPQRTPKVEGRPPSLLRQRTYLKEVTTSAPRWRSRQPRPATPRELRR